MAQATLQDIPQKIRSHMSSEPAIATMDDILERAELTSFEPLTSAIYKLLTKQIVPGAIITALSNEFDISMERAMSIADELKKRVFRPIESELLAWGVDLGEIETTNATPLENLSIASLLEGTGINPKEIEPKPVSPSAKSNGEAEIKKEEAPTTESEDKPVIKSVPVRVPRSNTTDENPPSPMDVIDNETVVTSDVKEKISNTKSIEVGPEPLVLHQESEEDRQIRTTPIQSRKKGGFTGGFFKSRLKPGGGSARAKINTPPNGEQIKTVHYSEYKTPTPKTEPHSESMPKTDKPSNKIPIDDSTTTTKTKINKKSGEKESFIDLGALEPSSKNKNKENGPELKGNTIDLRENG